MSEEIEENLVDDMCGECGSAMRVPESLVGELRCEACAEALPFLGFYDKRKIAAKDAEITRLKEELKNARDDVSAGTHAMALATIADQDSRFRTVVQILNEAVPLDGPKDAEDVARLAVDEITRLNAALDDAVSMIRCYGEILVSAGYPSGDRVVIRENIKRGIAALARVRGQRDYLGPIAHERLEQQGGKEYANGCLSLVGLRIINGTVEEIES